jgi:hypothetical protein
MYPSSESRSLAVDHHEDLLLLTDMARRNLSELRWSGMSAPGTKREFGQEHFYAGNPMHCRPSSLSVGFLQIIREHCRH